VKDYAAWIVISVKIGGGHFVMQARGHCLKRSSVSNGDFLFISVLFFLVESLLRPVNSLFVFHSHMREHPRN
jgi:hypothetical protein